jgi:5-methylcytosine-specific restriction endonuclease McrA
MQWGDRGPEPDGVRQVRSGYTRGGVDCYRNGMGTKPSDSYWRSVHGNLADACFSLCASCEAICTGEGDHFRPKRKFPESVYQWSNWVLTCHDCPNLKGEKWPAGG